MLSLNDPRLPKSPGKKSLLALTAAVFGCMLCMFCSFVALTITSSQAVPAPGVPGQVADAQPPIASAAPGDGAVVLALPSATPADSATPTETPAAAPSATDTPTPTPASTSTPTPTSTHVPSATFSPTPTPSDTPTRTPTRTPTATPKPTDTPTSTSTPAVTFGASQNPVERSQCTTVNWDVDNVFATYVFGGQQGAAPSPVVGHSSRSVCPYSDTEYTLRIAIARGTLDYPLTVQVVDTTPPPVPVPYAPNGNTCLDCDSPPPPYPTFQWSGVSDASGIVRYEWRLYTYGSGCTYCSLYVLVAAGTSAATSAPLPDNVARDTYYFWQARAVDGAGNAGPYSE